VYNFISCSKVIGRFGCFLSNWDRRGRDRMVVGLQLPVQSVPITAKVISSNPVHGKVHSI